MPAFLFAESGMHYRDNGRPRDHRRTEILRADGSRQGISGAITDAQLEKL